VNIPLVDLKEQYQGIKESVLAEIGQALEGMQLFLGKNVQAFESEFAAFSGAEYGIGVGSGTEALHLALRACGIEHGAEVITVANTFFATVEAIILAGGRPVFVDVDPETYNIDVSQIEDRITPNTKAILPVHIYGHPADMGPILELARAYNLRVIEDACQAHGASYNGKRAGSLGDVGCFSFYFTKNLGAYGESGMVVTSDPDIAKKCQMLRDHGQNVKYNHCMVGTNGRLDEIQAAVLRVKLPHLDEWNEKRRVLARAYEAKLPPSVVKPKEMSWASHVFHVYVIRTPKRDYLRDWLQQRGVGTGIHYPIPIHQLEAWSSLGDGNNRLPVTEKIAREIISLPMYPELSEEELQYVCDCVEQFVESEVDISGIDGNEK
jgi:dTDP-4-amino-4,6-dideoxygalactose transaminase